ncbi:class II histone deacetylase [Sulfitobacter alexandrii]|uniref:Class II histone deacetylase n=2 Tax=Sulfitobacter alexandrii TaxID=1917485 RepID=A0A1J0WJE5_9RHOB|nr:class II histone deacetylase [Sulfitobacter alexandrii]
MATGFLFHERYMWHDPGSAILVVPCEGVHQPMPSAETAEGKRRIRNLVEASGLSDHLVPLKPRLIAEADLLRFHTQDYLDYLKQIDKTGGVAGESVQFSAGGYEIARLSTGGVLSAMEAVLSGNVENAYALVRPPGHHAERDRARGFCLLANISVAIMAAQATLGVGRVAVVDWDVHHGNGTEQAFYDSADVLTISIHQDGNYPAETGGHDARGTGAGEGYNLNIPLPAGSGIGAYKAAFERAVLPALDAFAPDLIVIAAGFDANGFDPLARQLLDSETYRWMTARLMERAADLCMGRLLAVHEGGYSEAYVPYCAMAMLEEMSGHRTELKDPLQEVVAAWPGQDLQPHQQEAIERAIAGHPALRERQAAQ